jgi:hypothetical protein
MTPCHSIFITFGERNAIMTNWLEFRRFCETSSLSLFALTPFSPYLIGYPT